MTLVIADGSILTVNKDSNPDLFWGVRGGGGNFGVVTEFVYRLHPQRATVYAGILVFPPPALEKIVSLTSEWLASTDKDKERQAMLQMMTRGPNGQARSVFNLSKYLQPLILLLLAVCHSSGIL